MTTTTNTEHVFERAGLGKAPFRVVDVYRKVGPIPVGDGVTMIGAPGQPMGCCQFCFTGIAECWVIRSSDGKTFEVGCECVKRTGDNGLRKSAGPHLRKLRHAAQDRRIAKAATLYERADVRAVLEAMKRGTEPGAWSEADWIDFVMVRGGRSAKTKAARMIERAASTCNVKGVTS